MIVMDLMPKSEDLKESRHVSSSLWLWGMDWTHHTHQLHDLMQELKINIVDEVKEERVSDTSC